MTKQATFETTYPRYPFAPLVKLGLVISAWLKGTARNASKTDGAKRKDRTQGAVGHAA
jgi:hypothetical protein